ncbi:MAG TPA: hypothetical protein VMD59_20270 [Acidimicrobiales bacterium]|nr:hypothetical protein [Acidimicrobiales bacterium]
MSDDAGEERDGSRHSLFGEATDALSDLAARLREAANDALDWLEKPEELLAYSRRKLVERLEHLRASAARVASADRALVLYVSELEGAVSDLAARSTGAGASGETAVVALLLERHREAERTLVTLRAERDELDDDLDDFVATCRALATRVEQVAPQFGRPSDRGSGAGAGAGAGAAGAGGAGSPPQVTAEEVDELTSALAGAEVRARQLEERIAAVRGRASALARMLVSPLSPATGAAGGASADAGAGAAPGSRPAGGGTARDGRTRASRAGGGRAGGTAGGGPASGGTPAGAAGGGPASGGTPGGAARGTRAAGARAAGAGAAGGPAGGSSTAGPSDDPLDEELSRIHIAATVEEELAKLKERLRHDRSSGGSSGSGSG